MTLYDRSEPFCISLTIIALNFVGVKVAGRDSGVSDNRGHGELPSDAGSSDRRRCLSRVSEAHSAFVLQGASLIRFVRLAWPLKEFPVKFVAKTIGE